MMTEEVLQLGGSSSLECFLILNWEVLSWAQPAASTALPCLSSSCQNRKYFRTENIQELKIFKNEEYFNLVSCQN